MSGPSNISLSVAEGVGVLRLCRPEKRNAITNEMANEIQDAVTGLIAGGVRVCVLDAEGPVYCAGADFEDIKRGNPRIEDVTMTILKSPIFWIAAIRYPVLGAGLSLAAACPVAVASQDVWFSLPEVKLDFFPAGVAAYLEPVMGARRLLTAGLTGARVSAHEAEAQGLLSEVCAPDGVDAAIERWTSHAIAHPRTADGARRVWQSRFANASFDARKDLLGAIITEAIGPDPSS